MSPGQSRTRLPFTLSPPLVSSTPAQGRPSSIQGRTLIVAQDVLWAQPLGACGILMGQQRPGVLCGGRSLGVTQGIRLNSGSPGRIRVRVLVWLCALAATEPLPLTGRQLVCFEVLLSWLQRGVPRLEGEGAGLQPGQLSLTWAQPSLWSLGWVSP